VARYWSISAVPVSAHPSPLVITTKLAAAILVVAIVRRRGSAGPVLPLCTSLLSASSPEMWSKNLIRKFPRIKM